MTPATVAIVIATPAGLRHLASPSERAAAGPAEDVLRGLGAAVRSASFWVQCADPAAQARLTRYLWDVKAEILAEGAEHGADPSPLRGRGWPPKGVG